FRELAAEVLLCYQRRSLALLRVGRDTHVYHGPHSVLLVQGGRLYRAPEEWDTPRRLHTMSRQRRLEAGPPRCRADRGLSPGGVRESGLLGGGVLPRRRIRAVIPTHCRLQQPANFGANPRRSAPHILLGSGLGLASQA